MKLGIIAVALLLPLGAVAQPFSYNDVFELEFAAAPQVSPDGERLVYERRSFDIMQDRSRSNLWQLELDNGNHRPLLSGKANYRMAKFSPDGRRLAYLSSIEGDNQLYVRYLDSGDTVRVTNLQATPSSIEWSPNGKQLAFTLFTPSKPSGLKVAMPTPPKGAKWAGKATYIDQTRYRSDGSGFSKAGQRQIYVVPADGGTPHQLTQGEFPIGAKLSWHPNGRQILFDSYRSDEWQMQARQGDLYAVALADGAMTQLTDRSGAEASPTVSPNGKLVAYLQSPDNTLAHINSQVAVMGMDGSEPRLLTNTLDRGVSQLQWAKDGSGVYFNYTDHGVSRVGFVSLKGKITRFEVALGGQSLGRPYASGQFAVVGKNQLVYTGGDATAPADLHHLKRGKSRALTQLNQDLIGRRYVAPVTAITVNSSVDQRPIEAWIATPPNFDASKRYPMVLEIHGGPHAAYGPNFSMEVQLMAAQGYVVVWANPRGSSSYGSDFANTIHHNYPSEDYNDLMDVVDGVIAKGYVDPQQLFITGGSGGGTLTAWSIGKTDRFKAAVVAKPVINWMSFALTADMYPYFSQYWMPGKPWEHADHLWQRSPLSLVGNVTTPTMLLTGELDYRTPMSETEQYYQALQLNGVESAMVRIPTAGHGIANRPSNLIQKIAYIMAWFDKHRGEQPQ
ncbi:S9 family peptidase [uncultured Ferrimonas sp.]|uniref:S9 family peptidase n=1 Tax=uncultured Ferrimonas sp. TaxID=432640 RepID=UPI002621537D|nr:S9 family peptidase [uncultured Ferrimonas sp.]